MIIFGSVALLRPYWLLALPILVLMLRMTKSKGSLLGDWPRAIDAPLLGVILKRHKISHGSSSNLALYWTVGLIALALSGPATRLAERMHFRNLDVTMLVLDVSCSENLSKVASAAQVILSESGARQVGLILFAGDAYLASPHTEDTAALEALIFALDDKTVPEGGSRPDKALSLARRLLRDAHSFSGDIVFISDGVGQSSYTLNQATALSKDGHKLHTIFVSSSTAANASTIENRANMQSLARAGNGIMKDALSANEIVAEISRREIDHIAYDPRSALEWTDTGRYLLLFALIPFILCFRRGAL